MKRTIKKFNDVWLDNGLATFYLILKEVEENEALADLKLTDNSITFEYDDEELFTDELAIQIQARLNTLVLEVVDKRLGVSKEVKRDHILLQENKKIDGKVSFKEEIYQGTKTEKVIKEIFSNLDGEKKTCFFCNQKYSKGVKKLQQASYPFVTKIKSLSGIRKGGSGNFTEYISNYCPLCYLIGILEWMDESIVYRNLPGIKSILILPNCNSLKELVDIKDQIVTRCLNNSNRWSNIKIDTEKSETVNTPNKYTTFVSFYESYLREIRPDFKSDNWFIIEIPYGSVKNPKYYNMVMNDRLNSIFNNLIRKEGSYFYREFIKETYCFYLDSSKGMRDFDAEKIIHELLCEALLKNDFMKFSKTFIPSKGVKLGMSKDAYNVFYKLIEIWRIEKMNIENREEYLKHITDAGNALSKIMDNRTSLFFKLEKAKTVSQFIEGLEEVIRRLYIIKYDTKIYTNGIKEIIKRIVEKSDDKEFFSTTKNLILIFASLSNHYNSNKGEKNNE